MKKHVKNFLVCAFCCLIFGSACKKEEVTKDSENKISTSKLAMLSNIVITTPATKLIYTVGEPLDLTGLVITGTYSDGSKKVETITSTNVTGFNSSVSAVGQVLTITVEGKKITYTITVVVKTIQPTYSFKITNIEDITQYPCHVTYFDSVGNLVQYLSGYYDFAGGFRATGTYINETKEDIYPTGTIWYGDGTSEKFRSNFDDIGMGSFETKNNDFINYGTFCIWNSKCHKYLAPGVYRVKIELAVGNITSSFEKDLKFDCQWGN